MLRNGWYWLGRDDFNFSSWILSASSHMVPVTERITLVFNGYGVGCLLYPPRTLPMWQNSFQVCKNRFFGFPLLKSDRILAIFTQTSSVTKRNIMDRMDMALGMVYTPHQWTYSDRNDSYREKSTFSFLAANLSRTGQCFQHGKGVSLVPWYEDTKIFTPAP